MVHRVPCIWNSHVLSGRCIHRGIVLGSFEPALDITVLSTNLLLSTVESRPIPEPSTVRLQS